MHWWCVCHASSTVPDISEWAACRDGGRPGPRFERVSRILMSATAAKSAPTRMRISGNDVVCTWHRSPTEPHNIFTLSNSPSPHSHVPSRQGSNLAPTNSADCKQQPSRIHDRSVRHTSCGFSVVRVRYMAWLFMAYCGFTDPAWVARVVCPCPWAARASWDTETPCGGHHQFPPRARK